MQRARGPPQGDGESSIYTLDMQRRAKGARPRPKQGAHLNELRKKAGLTQTEVAKAIGVPQTTIAMWEWSDFPPRSDVLPALAEVLGVGVEDLLRAATTSVSTKRARPVGEIQRAFEAVRALPRKQQRRIIDTVFALIDRYNAQP